MGLLMELLLVHYSSTHICYTLLVTDLEKWVNGCLVCVLGRDEKLDAQRGMCKVYLQGRSKEAAMHESRLRGDQGQVLMQAERI